MIRTIIIKFTGLSLSVEQWEELKSLIPEIDALV